MILYALACDAGHRFDSWFRDSGAFEDQASRRLVTCPVCGSSMVVKSIMAPAVVGPRHEVVPAPPTQVALTDATARAAMRAFRDKVLAGGRDVGARFPDEARRMHDGDIPYQPIHGQASIEEARGLVEDGIMILPVPTLPEELN